MAAAPRRCVRGAARSGGGRGACRGDGWRALDVRGAAWSAGGGAWGGRAPGLGAGGGPAGTACGAIHIRWPRGVQRAGRMAAVVGGGCPLATLGRAIRPGPSPSMRANRACPPWRRPGKGYAIGSGRYGQGREKHGCRPWMRPGRGRCGWRGRHLRALRSHRRREAPSGRLRVAILKGRLMFRGMVCPVCADRVTRGVCAAAPRV